MTTPLENDLRAELDRRAGTIPVRSDPYGQVTARIAVSRRRRIAAAVVTAVLVLIAGAVSVPPVLKLTGLDLSPAKHTVTTWPARGSLAKDPSALDRIRAALPLQEGDNFEVLFAGDVEGRRVIVARGDGEDPLLWAMTAPEGTFPPDITRGNDIAQLGPPTAKAFGFIEREGDKERGRLNFFLAEPGVDRAEYSSAVRIDEDGKIQREWNEFDPEGGGFTIYSGGSDVWMSDTVRMRAIDNGKVVADVVANNDMQPYFVESDERLDGLAAEATSGHAISNVGKVLFRLETELLGRETISRVSQKWEKRTDTDIYAGIVVVTKDSGELELAVTGAGELVSLRVVRSGQAWALPSRFPDVPVKAPAPDLAATLDVPSTVGERVPR